jgi:hypothetical protein
VKYIVEQGDYLSKIASEHGFSDWRTIWHDPENAALKKKRGNPSVLFPGDVLVIPEREAKQEAAATDHRHTFVAERAPLALRLVLQDLDFKPLAKEKCTLEVDGREFELTTGSDGLVEQPISSTARTARLKVLKTRSVAATEVAIQLGHLDPLDTVTGQKARLKNLGYFGGALTDDDELLFRGAVEEFQCDHALTVDGKCGPKTQAKLGEVYGC